VLGNAMVVARLLDLLVDPVVGSLSDRWRTPFGRRRPWLIIGVPILLTGTTYLFNPPPGVSLTYFLVWLGVMYAGLSLIGVPHRAWGAELSPYYHERTRISAVRQFFSTGGLIVSTVVPAIVLSRQGAGGGDVLAALSLLMVIVLPAMALICVVFVPEPRTPVVTHERVSLGASLRAMRRNGPLRSILLVLFVGFAAETFRQTMTVFFARDVIGVPNLGLVYVYYFVAAFLGVPVWRLVARRTSKHQALALGMVIAIGTNLALFFLHHGDVALFTAMFVVKGFCFGALDLLPAAMVADAADVDTAISGKARVGFLFAIAGVVTNLGAAVGQGVSLNALAFVGYHAAGETGGSQILALRILYSLVPSIALAAAMVVTLGYGLSATRHDRLRAALQRRAARLGAARQH
jgi:glycoside/pentoside/hexuronide:cation symporter, GPH family